LGDNQTLDPVNEGLIALANREEESQDLTYNGFTFQIEEVPFSPTVTRKRAIAFKSIRYPFIRNTFIIHSK
jgi:hypothetical protein